MGAKDGSAGRLHAGGLSTLERLAWSNAACFLPVVAAVAVLAPATYLNRVIDVGSGRLALPRDVVIDLEARDLAVVARDLLARVNWSIGAMVVLATCVAVVGFAGFVVVRALRGWAGRQYLGAALGLLTVAGLLAGAVAAGGEEWLLTEPRVTAQLLDATLEAVGLRQVVDVQLRLRSLMYLGVAALLAGFSALLAVPHRSSDRDPGAEPAELATRNRWLRWLLYAGAAMLVTTVLEIHLYYGWTGAFLADADGQLVHKISRGIALTLGNLFSLLLISLYLSAAAVQRCRALSLVRREEPEASPAQHGQMLAEKGLGLSPLGELTRLAVTVSPLLAGSSLTTLLDLLVR